MEARILQNQQLLLALAKNQVLPSQPKFLSQRCFLPS
jgi:hypothetical protein